MGPHNQHGADILPFGPIRERYRQGVVYLPLHRMASATLDEGMREALEQEVRSLRNHYADAPADYPIAARFVDPPRHVTVRPSFAARLRAFLDDNTLFGICLGFSAGMLATAGLAELVAWVLL